MIINPNADFGRAWHVAADLRPVVEEFGGADWAGTVYPTHASELARQAGEQGYELIIATGGDGTIHEVVNGLMQLPKENRPRLGVVPLGSGNDFSYALGLDNNPALALRQILTGSPRSIDIGKVSEEHGRMEYWNNILGIGFDAITNYNFRKITYLRGYSAYLMAVLQTIALNHNSMQVKIQTDKEEWEQESMLIVAANGFREGGGFEVAPGAVLDDGLFNYVVFDSVSQPMMLKMLLEVMRGTHEKSNHVKTGKFRKMTIDSKTPLFAHMEGEFYAGYGTDVHHLEIELLPGEIEVMF
jgi:YegS/Rv2252/BmrU family lipid kinase